jgi:NAD(P)-dependent dehydrogenase (short-subunit alcohol dehydrogenase family)
MADCVALITGAAAGIGWAMAQRFAAGGCSVALADLRKDAADARAAELGEGHFAIAADVASEPDVLRMVGEVRDRFGRLDVLINNAGISDTQLPTIEQSVDAFDRLIGVHLRGTFLVCREAARIMLEQGQGAIVNVSSIAGLTGLPRRNAYGAAKAGIVAMTRAMACEWGGQGLRVNAIAPGYVQTALIQELADAGRVDIERIRRRTPLRRLALPSEIAEAAWFLASPQASFITGTVLSVDGGWIAFGDASGGT